MNSAKKQFLHLFSIIIIIILLHGCNTVEENITCDRETPTQLLAENFAENIPEGPLLTGTKWNPGHYAFITVRSDKNFFTVDPSRISNLSKIQFNAQYLDKFLKDLGPNFAGIQIGCIWPMFEPEKDKYNFKYIDTVLEVCEKNNKQLQILFSDRVFNNEVIPVPKYIIDDPQYGGGYTKFGHGLIMAFWNKNTVTRHNILLQKLGNRYNRHRNFELICFSESALSFGSNKPPNGANGESYISYLKERVVIAKKYFPNTVVLQGFNWGWANVLPDHCVKNAVGFYGPDVVPDKERFLTKKRIVAYEYYQKLAGKIPLKCDVQSPELKKPVAEWGKFTIEGIYDMGINVLKLNYMSWVVVEWGDSYYSFSKDIKPYIDKKGKFKNTQIPSLIAPDLNG